MLRLSIAACPSSPIRGGFGRSPGGAYQNLPVLLSFTVHRRTELPWRGICIAWCNHGCSWFPLSPSVPFPLPCSHLCPGTALAGQGPWARGSPIALQPAGKGSSPEQALREGHSLPGTLAVRAGARLEGSESGERRQHLAPCLLCCSWE